MECAVLKRFLKVQGTFSIKKFLQIPLSVGKKLNLIRLIKTLLKEFTPHPLRFAQHLLPKEEGLLSAILYLVPKYRDLSRYFTESFDPTFKEPQR